ncbi:hypothetical protein T492DRAFT_900479 [Pavlovales sp. CCMP2436]|nr:hypothetical protein T492DRAFT_900479 [Pavlovales sp. CCMP2436]
MSVARMGQLRLVIDEVRAVHDVARAQPSPVRLTAPPRPTGGLAALLVYGPHAPNAPGATTLSSEALGTRPELPRLAAADAARLDDVGLVRVLAERSERIGTDLLVSCLLRRLREDSSGLSRLDMQKERIWK